MTVLSMQIVRALDAQQDPLDGTCTNRQLKDVSLIQLLGIEFTARTRKRELLSISQEMFLLLAKAHNDKGALQALEAVEHLIVTTKTKNCFDLKISYDEFQKRRRQEQEVFFDWLFSVYWGLPLYTAVSDEDRNCNPGFRVNSNLPLVKKRILGRVASIWGGREDALGLRAFEFLCDCFDWRRLQLRAPSLVKDIATCLKQHERRYAAISNSTIGAYPKEETDHVLGMIKSNLPRELGVITAWIRRAQEAHLPEGILKVLKHAYVNAGGEIPTASA